MKNDIEHDLITCDIMLLDQEMIEYQSAVDEAWNEYSKGKLEYAICEQWEDEFKLFKKKYYDCIKYLVKGTYREYADQRILDETKLIGQCGTSRDRLNWNSMSRDAKIELLCDRAVDELSTYKYHGASNIEK